MIAEFGVEPEVLAQWRYFQSLWEDFGIAQRRQIGLYPKKWKAVTIDRARALIGEGKNTEMQVAKMIVRLSGDGAKAKFRKTNCADWNPECAWLDNARAHQPPFDATLATAAPAGSGVLVAGEFLRDELPYEREASITIPRTVAGIVGAAWPLIESAATIVLVEPNFDPMEPRFLDPLVEIIERIQKAGVAPRRLELHTCKFRDRVSRVRPANYRQRIAPHLLSGWKLEVCFWAETKPEHHLHARLILTEIGGLHYDHGLDAGPDGSTTLISGLGDAVHQEFFARFSAGGSVFLADNGNERITVS